EGRRSGHNGGRADALPQLLGDGGALSRRQRGVAGRALPLHNPQEQALQVADHPRCALPRGDAVARDEGAHPLDEHRARRGGGALHEGDRGHHALRASARLRALPRRPRLRDEGARGTRRDGHREPRAVQPYRGCDQDRHLYPVHRWYHLDQQGHKTLLRLPRRRAQGDKGLRAGRGARPGELAQAGHEPRPLRDELRLVRAGPLHPGVLASRCRGLAVHAGEPGGRDPARGGDSLRVHHVERAQREEPARTGARLARAADAEADDAGALGRHGRGGDGVVEEGALDGGAGEDRAERGDEQ
ncbi:MAG: FIG069887: hypothetical protein, partial [uncultured Rubrobacteraceae bacterium]